MPLGYLLPIVHLSTIFLYCLFHNDYFSMALYQCILQRCQASLILREALPENCMIFVWIAAQISMPPWFLDWLLPLNCTHLIETSLFLKPILPESILKWLAHCFHPLPFSPSFFIVNNLYSFHLAQILRNLHLPDIWYYKDLLFYLFFKFINYIASYGKPLLDYHIP